MQRLCRAAVRCANVLRGGTRRNRLEAEASLAELELFNIMLIMQCLRRRSGCCIIAFALCYIATLRLRLPLPIFGSEIQTKSQYIFGLIGASRRQVPNHSRSYFPLLSLGTCSLRLVIRLVIRRYLEHRPQIYTDRVR